MRILHVNKFYYHRGGAENVYFALTDLLERNGHEVIPFSMQDPRNVESPYAKYFVRHVELREEGAGLLAKIATAGRIIYSREADEKLDALIRDTRPDIAHLHNIYHQLSPSILRTLRRQGVPAVMTLHDYKLICPSYTLHSGDSICESCKGHRYYNAVRHSCVKGSRAKSAICAAEAYVHDAAGTYRRNIAQYIAPSTFMARKVIEFGIDPACVTVVPNFVRTQATTNAASGQYVLYAGRLERVKGVATLVRAWRDSAIANAYELWIAGDGEARAELERYCDEHELRRVRFLGHLSPAQTQTVLSEARFVVVPSEWYENAPLSVMEAAAQGKAVVASDIGGLPELVRDGETGLLFTPGDAQALRDAIESLLLDADRAEAMGRRGEAFMREKFNERIHYEGTLSVYQHALSASSPEIVRAGGA